MTVLTPQQRNALESAIKQARRLAESGAKNALQALGVDNPEPFSHMKPEQRSIRNRLRSKARLLGDELPSNGYQQIDHLTYELAYEYWHKMLFAKFLEVNGLLMHPDGVPVTMEECEELAKEEGYIDKWDAAAGYASKMLPAIFRPEDPLLQVSFSPNDRIKLEGIIDDIDECMFTADDALGWVYQFWQSETKDVINKSGDKINGEKLPAVTQLFTEPYMVHFLIDNTVGAWWVSRNPGIKPPVNFEYLRLLDDGKPAAGSFEGWPDKTAEVTALDPCMGSGHFIITLFSVFVQLRMHEEGLSKEEATDRVIIDNLHGLELDARCTQIAAFNLALTAWKFYGKYKDLPVMNLACSGLSPKGRVDDWVKLVVRINDTVQKARLENGMRTLYTHFQLAPEIGSLIDPTILKPDAFTASYEELLPLLEKALLNETDKDIYERGVIAAGIAKAGQILSHKYTLLITNVPYLSRGKQDKILANYCSTNFKEAKGDLATVFFERMLNANKSRGTSCCVIPQNWLFLTSYKKFREKLLKKEEWNLIARLGPKAFQTPMWDFNVMLISLTHFKANNEHLIAGLDVSNASTAEAKSNNIVNINIESSNQRDQLDNPDSRIIFGINVGKDLLKNKAESLIGLQSGDSPKYIFYHYEVPQDQYQKVWEFHQSTVPSTQLYNGNSLIFRWEDGKGTLIKESGARIQGTKAFSSYGVLISCIGKLPATLYLGSKYDNNSAVILPYNPNDLDSIWCYCASPEFHDQVRKIDQKLNVTNATLVKVPFDSKRWREIASKEYPTGIPKPYSNDPTLWLFHGHPIKSEYPLQTAVIRLLGYRWPAEIDKKMDISEDTEHLVEEISRFNYLTDTDGIICLPSVNAEDTATNSLRDYLMNIMGDKWGNKTIQQLLIKENATSKNFEYWLRNEFFIQHCKVFKNRPFIWQIWDGRNDGFSVLVNYHKLNKENLAKLIYTYLGDWIRMCDLKKRNGESGAEGLLNAALKLKVKLELILEGEAPYDIFVRWKPIEQQPIGWDPDLNDGVRLNIRPFIEANVLRKNPHINYGVDRGKNPPESPWGEKRDNDIHLTLAEKIAARKKAK